jgi:hypothetical protein
VSALDSGAIKIVCNVFVHCSFPEEMHLSTACSAVFLASCDGPATRGTVLCLADHGTNSEIEYLIF